MESLDPDQSLVTHTLNREHCTFHHEGYVKDLSRLGRPLKDVLLLDVMIE